MSQLNLKSYLTRQMRKTLRMLLASSAGALFPQFFRHHLIRRNVKYSFEPPEGVIFKLAETKDELSQAFKLLHDNYVASGYMDAHPSGMRLTKYHILPSTSTLIAKKGETVIATVSLIRSSAFGVPCEQAYDISFLKKKHARITEVSALSVHRSYSHKQGEILWPLLKYKSEYVRRFYDSDYFVIVTTPVWFEFYAATWLFQEFSPRKIKYSYVKGTKSKGGFSKHRAREYLMENFYGSEKPEKNAHRYYYETSFECFKFPQRKNSSINNPVMSAELINYFFNEKSDVLATLSDLEKFYLRNLYNSPEYDKFLPQVNMDSLEHIARRHKRYDVDCQGELEFGDNARLDVEIKTVSHQGVGCVLHREIPFAKEYLLRIFISRGKDQELIVTPLKKGEDDFYTFIITKVNDGWKQIMDDLESDLLKGKLTEKFLERKTG